jgi:hypothetical protein
MKYPALNISEKTWKGKELELDAFILFDEFNYNKNVRNFEKYFLNKMYCDSNGEIFRITGRTLPVQTWRTILSFLPNVFKCKYITKRTNEKLTLEELRKYLLERISELEDFDLNIEWKENVRKAKTHAELINDN